MQDHCGISASLGGITARIQFTVTQDRIYSYGAFYSDQCRTKWRPRTVVVDEPPVAPQGLRLMGSADPTVFRVASAYMPTEEDGHQASTEYPATGLGTSSPGRQWRTSPIVTL